MEADTRSRDTQFTPGYVLRSHADQLRQSLAISHQLPDVNALFAEFGERLPGKPVALSPGWSHQLTDSGGIVSNPVRSGR